MDQHTQKQPRPRIADPEWWETRRDGLGVVNANYTRGGVRVADHTKPWIVNGWSHWKQFTTHAEAVAWAFKEVGK